jgi:hypothetical protein
VNYLSDIEINPMLNSYALDAWLICYELVSVWRIFVKSTSKTLEIPRPTNSTKSITFFALASEVLSLPFLVSYPYIPNIEATFCGRSPFFQYNIFSNSNQPSE